MIRTPPTKEQLARQAAQGHRRGRQILHPDGTAYLVTETGAWERVTPRRHEHRQGMTKAARRRNRKARAKLDALAGRP